MIQSRPGDWPEDEVYRRICTEAREVLESVRKHGNLHASIGFYLRVGSEERLVKFSITAEDAT